MAALQGTRQKRLKRADSSTRNGALRTCMLAQQLGRASQAAAQAGCAASQLKARLPSQGW
jgi:hypothetical protein